MDGKINKYSAFTIESQMDSIDLRVASIRLAGREEWTFPDDSREQVGLINLVDRGDPRRPIPHDHIWALSRAIRYGGTTIPGKTNWDKVADRFDKLMKGVYNDNQRDGQICATRT
ncbi:hypothetical protein IAR55_004491 [Kwoniella newhampshirensis]|uniref:Uncharacterized protein n=1 Tax=Kwoniella newhampshirensis TaxID=1651941 RepID=A0AAW0YXV6_9TREE